MNIFYNYISIDYLSLCQCFDNSMSVFIEGLTLQHTENIVKLCQWAKREIKGERDYGGGLD